jgi:hypothetical protein
VKKAEQPKKPRYTPKPPPTDSFAFSVSPLNATEHVTVKRWCSYHGIPTLFMVVDEHGDELGRFPRETDALAHASALEAELEAGEE